MFRIRRSASAFISALILFAGFATPVGLSAETVAMIGTGQFGSAPARGLLA